MTTHAFRAPRRPALAALAALILLAGPAAAAPPQPEAGSTTAAKPKGQTAVKPASKPATKPAGGTVAKPSGQHSSAAKPGAKKPASNGAAAAAVGATGARVAAAAAAGSGSFSSFVQGLWPAAQARGVSRATFDAAFAGVTPDPKVAALTRKQSEFVRPIWGYLDGAVTSGRVAQGQAMAQAHAATLAAIESRFGVDRSVILGVWGMETNFGSFTGGMDVIRSLATLAHLRYRSDFFRDELLTALVILQQGHVSREAMRGSWAGAMGQTQFMPSSFMKWAVDWDGDGHKDIWTSVPDALASTANYLRQHGWQGGLPWAVEVVIPDGFDYRMRRGDLSGFAGRGVRRADGKPMPRGGEALLFLPAGARGPAFLVTENYAAIKAYNSSDAYALGVGHLGDRIYGGAPIQGDWPRSDPQLDHKQRVDLQKRLAALGYQVGEPDGKIGTKTRDAVRDFQEKRGLVPDGHPTPAVLQALRAPR
jgi:hypothetical protein